MEKHFRQLLWLAIRRLFSYVRSVLDSKWSHNKAFYVTQAKDSNFDPRNYMFEEHIEIAWITTYEELPAKIDLYDWHVTDQGNTNHCVWYWATAWRNECVNFIDEKLPHKNIDTKYVNPVDTVNYIRSNLDANIDRDWTWIINGPKALQQMGKIEKYIYVSSINQIKYMLFLGCSVVTWTNQFDWRETGKKWVAVLGNGGGHKIHINWYDDNITLIDSKGKRYRWWFKVKNTWGRSWGIDWHYWIPYELYNNLYNSKFALYYSEALTKEIEKPNMLFKDVDEKTPFYNSIKWAKENWIVNWYSDGTLRPNENLDVKRMLAILENFDKYLNNKM